jgi:hypothetical protein
MNQREEWDVIKPQLEEVFRQGARTMGFLQITLGATLIASTMTLSAYARGSFASEEPSSIRHIEALPITIQRSIRHYVWRCGNAVKATHYFAVSISTDGDELISLHFENISCDDRRSVCDSGECLHQVYLKSRGRYILVFSAYATEVTIRSRGIVILEVIRNQFRADFKWNGVRFMPVSASIDR